MTRHILQRLTLLLPLALPACVDAPDQRFVAAGDLPPIARDYRRSIVSWARSYYPASGVLRDARISDPVLARDSTGRLVWLVCLEVRDAGPAEPRYARQAFGFAPNYVSAPLARGGSSLSRDDCDRPLAWRAFPQPGRI